MNHDESGDLIVARGGATYADKQGHTFLADFHLVSGDGEGWYG